MLAIRPAIARYNKLLVDRPVITNAVTAGLLGMTGDAVCQFGIEGKTLATFDTNRMLSMATFSAFYSRVNFKLFQLYPRILPAVVKRKPLGEGVASSLIDNLVHSPLLYLPTFFLWTGAVEGKTISRSMEDMCEQFSTIMQSLLLIWLPVNTFTFSVVPQSQRVCFVAVANLVWNIVLDHLHHHGAPDFDFKKWLDLPSISFEIPSDIPVSPAVALA
ncbi:Mpv17-like protein 2 [Hondaea fermentalgiana]|uniref:Mpv17-like protein 2 n=1 Tax=Hondaea fermentalgiana TaxID=2315210 RepID=A0A2R5G553_9STRA|nr:Mpv17-like protein 2 [Hondaea fermentalgiana]|eukprot:GBG26162.1 Mpv17-like protein 2 [Hondaea fermentalgiana]